MMSGDDFYDEDVTSGFSLLDYADFRRAELKHSASCASCGSPEPVRIEGDVCSDCSEFDRCPLCGRWIGEGFATPVTVIYEGRITSICEPCFMRQSPSVPLDYREIV